MPTTWSDEDASHLITELGLGTVGGLDPDRSQLRALLLSGEVGPLQFVNLLAYRSEALYPEGHELDGAGLTGAQAYGRYGAVALDHVVRRGGTLTLYNDVLQLLIGSTASWDQVAIMQYPGIDAFVDMIRDPDYQGALVHRTAGLADTVVLVTRDLLAG